MASPGSMPNRFTKYNVGLALQWTKVVIQPIGQHFCDKLFGQWFSVTRFVSKLEDITNTGKFNTSSSSICDTFWEVGKQNISLTHYTFCLKQGRLQVCFYIFFHKSDSLFVRGTTVFDLFLKQTKWTALLLSSFTILIWVWEISHARKMSNLFSRVSLFSRKSRPLTFPSAIPSITPSSRQTLRWITSLILSVNLEVTKNRYPQETWEMSVILFLICRACL